MEKSIFIGSSKFNFNTASIKGELVLLNGEKFYKIFNYHQMLPFFMSIVSDSNHWMFISSKGGLTAGRKNPDFPIFPYVTDDKIHDASENTGSKTILFVDDSKKTSLWEPFCDKYLGVYNIVRNCYKNTVGNKILFEEINNDLKITFRYTWCNSDKFGFVKKSEIINLSNSKVSINILDGVQNILPALVNRGMQTSLSTLIDGYKKNELISESQMGVYSLSSIPVDRAEPSESLIANIAWHVGFDHPKTIVSSNQLQSFIFHQKVEIENETRAVRGAFFQQSEFVLNPNETKNWFVLLDVQKDIAQIAALRLQIKNSKNIIDEITNDIERGVDNLKRIVSKADGIQLTADELSASRHFSNVLYNVMRGGIFMDHYIIETKDFISYVNVINKKLVEQHQAFLKSLPDTIDYLFLVEKIRILNNANFVRLANEYLPLSFSRRHGDPSRPWNLFNIDTKNNDGSKVMNYQGNWRDIFQNWEALAISYPTFIESMISKFVNSSTVDGYNPYRVTRDGFEWELLDLHDPWSFIGYWGDHQIIYLLKLLELSNAYHLGKIDLLLTQNNFSFANVPYRIKSYSDIIKDPNDTIIFDEELQSLINERVKSIGNDGKNVLDKNNEIYQVNLTEKLLIPVLAKFTNFVPEAGIWMNTQRPEWNDANNALVGNGASMVTMYHLRRFITFFKNILDQSAHASIDFSEEVAEWFSSIHKVIADHIDLTQREITNTERLFITNLLGIAGEKYREGIYKNGFSSKKKSLSIADIKSFCLQSLLFIDHSIKANKRSDNLYHSYNIIKIDDDKIAVKNLHEMLEGQVAILNSGFLTSEGVVEILKALEASKIYRHDQQSYMLYPNRQLPLFIDKNNISEKAVSSSKLLQKLIHDNNKDIIVKDENGDCHFNGDFRNGAVLKERLNALKNNKYSEFSENDFELVSNIYEEVFHHSSFTGRSGTFYKYEGLGSIYWHMVSKLLLAVKESYFEAYNKKSDRNTIDFLYNAYYKIRMGIGVTKSPELYGAFPIDPYSHTPGHAGVQQPGMTGQVKEDIISRWGELGICVSEGTIVFNPCLLSKKEFLLEKSEFVFYDLNGLKQVVTLDKGMLAFTFCQVLMVYHLSNIEKIKITGKEDTEIKSLVINKEIATEIFNRTNNVSRIDVFIK